MEVVHRTPSGGAEQAASPARVVGTAGLVAMVFFNVCGGPYGSEEIVSAAGPLIGLLSLLLFPLVWCLPMASLASELATTFPSDGGAIVWVSEAFGPTVGFQEGYWNWISGVLDTALYPLLAADMVLGATDTNERAVFWFKLAFVAVFSVPNFLGLKVMDNVLVALGAAVLVPFAALCVIGAPKMHLASIVATKPVNEMQFGRLVNILFWNMNGFTGAGLVAGEVREPARTIPRALTIAVVLVVATYFLPLLVASGVNAPPWQEWTDGSFANIAKHAAGSALGWIVLVTSVVGNIGLFLTDILLNAYALVGMAERQYVPTALALRKNRFNAPWMSLGLTSAIVMLLMMFDFGVVLEVSNVLNCCALLLLVAAGIHLRRTRPHVTRPVKVPLTGWHFYAAFVGPITVTLGIFASVIVHGGTSFLLSLLTIALGFAAFAARHRWMNAQPPASQLHDSDTEDGGVAPSAGVARRRGFQPLRPAAAGPPLSATGADVTSPPAASATAAADGATGTVAGIVVELVEVPASKASAQLLPTEVG